MIYLKIFHKQFLLIFLLFLSGCISNPDNINKQIVSEPVLSVNEQNITLEEDSSVDLVKIEEPLENIDWMIPTIEKFSAEIYLPEVPVKEKLIVVHEITEYFSDDSDYGWAYVPETNIAKEPVVVSPGISLEKVIPEEKENSFIIISEANKNHVVTKQDISAPVFEKLDISLEGRGWIYLPDNVNSNIEYKGRKFIDNNTIYTFSPKIEGNYVLRFQFQDLSSDIFNVEEINLKILKASDLVMEITEKSADVPDDSDLEEIEIYDLESKVSKLIYEANSTDLAAMIPDILDSKISSVIDKLPEIAEFLYNSSYFVSAASILEVLIKDNSITSGSDYFLFLLGNIYEKESSIRNEQKSAQYYKILMDNYHASIYWEESQDRYRFLKRRYIDIR